MPSELSSPKWGRAWAKGARGLVEDEGHLRPGSVAMFGSASRWELLLQAQREGRTWYYGDHSYFSAMRDRQYRVTVNAYQHFGPSVGAKPHRFEKCRTAIQPWRKDGEYILMCPQSDRFMRLMGLDPDEWRRQAEQTARLFTDRPLRWRMKRDATPFSAEVQRARCVVTYTSAAAVEAVLAGVPCVVTAPCAATPMATPWAGIERPRRPDREEWAWGLADRQFSLAEMESGLAWRTIAS